MFHRGICAWVLDRKWFFQISLFLKRILKERPVAPSLHIWYHHRAVGLPHVSNPQTSSARNQDITNRFMNLQPESFNQTSKLIKHTDEFIISFKIRAVLIPWAEQPVLPLLNFYHFEDKTNRNVGVSTSSITWLAEVPPRTLHQGWIQKNLFQCILKKYFMKVKASQSQWSIQILLKCQLFWHRPIFYVWVPAQNL